MGTGLTADVGLDLRTFRQRRLQLEDRCTMDGRCRFAKRCRFGLDDRLDGRHR